MVFKVKSTAGKDVNVLGDIYFTSTPKERNSFIRFSIICLIFLMSVAVFICSMNFFLGRSPIRICFEIKNSIEPVCSGIPDIEKFDCYPDAPVTESECVNRGCCYSMPKDASTSSLPPLNIPYCYYSANYVGYKIEDVAQTSRRMLVKLQRVLPSGFQKDVSNLDLLISFIDDNIVRLKITDADSHRYEVPIQLQYEYKELNYPSYEVIIDSSSGVLTIKRKSSGTIVFSTNLSRLVYSDQFLQLSSNLPSKYVYGIGEHYGGMLKSVNWTRFTMINSDQAPIPNHGLYGSHPFYMSLEKDGNATGVFLFNSNIMDVILQPTPAITFRPIGGILDFFVMLGPSPKAVTEQYSSIVGKTFMPPFWSLGFHLCRYGYKTLNKTRAVMQRTIDAKIPLEVQWNDIDYMDNYKDFTYDKTNFAGLPEFIDDLHSRELQYIVMTDPGLSNSEKVYSPYDEGLDDDIFVKNSNDSIFVGKVWTSGTTVFPDFSHPAAIPFWTRQFKRFYGDVKFDGIWIDMNEPSNFWNGGIDGCPTSSLETPQYVPGGNVLNTKTVCMSAKHYYTTHYNEHNIYGYREAVATNEALKSVRRKRPFIISRATFPGQGVHSGHWSGDVFSTWEDMRYSVSSLINFNMYAIPMVGTDICGFNGNTTVELCARWQAVGAFYPFARNHNERVTIEQDPVALGPTVVEAAKNSLEKRYSLLHYLYTLFYRSHAFGETVVRPLYFEFPKDAVTYSIDEQFLWGTSLMIVPVLYPNTTTVNAYFPKGLWYQFNGHKMNTSGEYITLDIPINDIFLYFRGGSILPGSNPAMTTAAVRRNPIILAVVLDEHQEACGELYLDDGDSLETYENEFYNLIQFQASPGRLNSSIKHGGYQKNMNLEFIRIAGLNQIPSEVTFNGNACSSEVSLNFTSKKDGNLFKKNSFFHFDAQSYKASLGNSICTFSRTQNFFTISTQPVTLLSPLMISWK